MWYPSIVTVAPAIEPITLDQAKAQCGMLPAETHANDLLTRIVKAARAHAEKYCNARWAEQTIAAQCDGFGDLRRLPDGPLKAVTSLSYIDVDGASQTLSDTAYEVHKDGLEPSIALKHGAAWPAIRPGSRITLTAVFGGAVPEDVQQAMLLLVGHWFLNREAVVTGTIATSIPMAVDALLSNHRRGV